MSILIRMTFELLQHSLKNPSYFFLLLFTTKIQALLSSGILFHILDFIFKIEVFILIIGVFLSIKITNKFLKNLFGSSETLFYFFFRFENVSFLCGLILLSTIFLSYLKMFVFSTFLFTLKEYSVVSAIYIFVWFSYHILVSRVSTEEIKSKLYLYLSIATTIPVFSLYFFGTSIFQEIFTVYAISFSWLWYLISDTK